MAQDIFNRTLDFNTKIKYLIASWALIEFVLVDAVYKFIVVLQNKDILHLGQKVSGSELLWGNRVIANVLKLIIVCIFAFIFGVAYTYLARKVTESDKVKISLVNSIIAVFGTIIILLIILWAQALIKGEDPQIRESLAVITRAVSHNGIYTLLILGQLVGAGIFTFIGLGVGQRFTSITQEETGKLFGVKWYHYLWLWFALSTYFQSLLFLIYITAHVLRVFIGQFRLWEIFGVTTSSQPSNSIESLALTLGVLYIIAMIIVIIIKFEREILSGDRKSNMFVAVLISVLVAFIIPMLLITYTAIGSTSV